MPPRQGDPDPTRANEWLRKARDHLKIAGGAKLLPHVDLAIFAYHAQQAAELALKAVFHSIALPYALTHDIGVLMQRLEKANLSIPDELRYAVVLTRYYVETRYPDRTSTVTQQDLVEATQLAESVLTWAESASQGGSGTTP